METMTTGAFGGVCSWNSFGSFYYMSGFTGYMILAHYLMRNPVKCSNTRLAAITIPMFIVGYIATTSGFMSMMPSGNWALIELFLVVLRHKCVYDDTARFPVGQALAGKSLSIGNPTGNHVVRSLSVSFSIVQWGYEVMYATGLPAWLRLALNAVCSTIVSFAIVSLMMRCRPLRRFVM